jgi:ubiquinol-cytochrome c reductase subunit 8
MRNAVFNTARRVRGQILYVAPPFVVAYLLVSWMEEKYVSRLLIPCSKDTY